MINENTKYVIGVMRGQITRLQEASKRISDELLNLKTQLSYLMQSMVDTDTLPTLPSATHDTPAVEQVQNSPSDEMVHHHAQMNLFNLLATYISPEVWTMGMGFLKPAVWTGGEQEDYGRKLLQYQEDIAKMDIDKLLNWPSGFYRDSQTKRPQLFIKANTCWLLFSQPTTQLLSEPPQQTTPAIHGFFISPIGEGITRIALTDMTLEQIQALSEEMKQSLDLLTK